MEMLHSVPRVGVSFKGRVWGVQSLQPDFGAHSPSCCFPKNNFKWTFSRSFSILVTSNPFIELFDIFIQLYLQVLYINNIFLQAYF